MKKNILFILLSSFLSAPAFSQFSVAPRIGVGSTITSSYFVTKIDSLYTRNRESSQPGITAQIGLELRLQCGKAISVESGIFYQYKSQRTGSTIFGIPLDKITINNMHYINMPLEIVFRKAKGGFYGGAGVNFGYGIGGEHKLKYSDDRFTESLPVIFDNKAITTDGRTHLDPLTVALCFKLGHSFNSVYLGADFNIGLKNISPYQNLSYKTSSIGLHFGYHLNKKSGKKKV